MYKLEDAAHYPQWCGITKKWHGSLLMPGVWCVCQDLVAEDLV